MRDARPRDTEKNQSISDTTGFTQTIGYRPARELSYRFLASAHSRCSGYQADLHKPNKIHTEKKNEPNKALEPRRLLVTDRAYARSAPSNRLAQLGR
jgi:hypothetical protein